MISLSREVLGEGTYVQGEDLEISVVLTRQGDSRVIVLGLEERLPAGWSFQGVSGLGAPQVATFYESTRLVEFAWFPNAPEFPVEFQYTVSVPFGQIGLKEIRGEALYRIVDGPGELRSESVLTTVESRRPSRTFYLDAEAASGGDGSSDAPFATLSDALEATEPFRGDIVIATRGTYGGNVEVPAFARLLSEDGAFHTKIDSVDSTADAVTLNQGAILRGFRVGGASIAAGVRIKYAGDFTVDFTVEVTNCVIDSNDSGVFADSGTVSSLVNNTFYSNVSFGVFLSVGATMDALQNNIVVANGVGVSADVGSIAEHSNNLLFENIPEGEILPVDFEGVGPDQSDFVADPFFVDAAGSNFHLQRMSPGRNAGDPSSEFDDLDGSRNDIGADGGPYGVQDLETPRSVITSFPDPPIVNLGVPLALMGDSSSDEWGIASFSWDFDASDGIQTEGTEAVEEISYPEGGTYIVTLAVTDHSGLVGLSSVAAVAGNVPRGPVTISGAIRFADGTPAGGIAVFGDSGAGFATTDPDGMFVLAAPSGWSGSIQPIFEGLEFSPATLSFSNVINDFESQDFVAVSFQIEGEGEGEGDGENSIEGGGEGEGESAPEGEMDGESSGMGEGEGEGASLPGGEGEVEGDGEGLPEGIGDGEGAGSGEGEGFNPMEGVGDGEDRTEGEGEGPGVVVGCFGPDPNDSVKAATSGDPLMLLFAVLLATVALRRKHSTMRGHE